MKYFSSLVAFIAIVLCLVLFYKLDKLQNGEKKQAENEAVLEEPASTIDPVATMGRLQVYMNKLYFAGKAENKALYQFYLTEMREAMHELSKAKIRMNGIDLSGNMDAFGLPAIQVIEKRVGEEGFVNFDEHYNNVVTACNSCHKVSQKGFISITVPKTPIYDNQDYQKGEFSDMKVDTDGD